MLNSEEILEILTPKIKSVLTQTPYQNREDLEQQLKMLVLEKMKTLEFKNEVTFFDLLRSENRE